MNEKKTLAFCLAFGGTVYETIRTAGHKKWSLLRGLLDYLDPVPVKPRLCGWRPVALIERAGPILAELSENPGRHDFFHHSCVGNLNMGQFLIEAVAAIKYSRDGYGSGEATDGAEEFIKKVEEIVASFSC